MSDRRTNEELLDTLVIPASHGAKLDETPMREARIAVLSRMEQGAVLIARCERTKELAGKCIEDITAGRGSEGEYSEDEKQQLSTLLGMVSAADIIQTEGFRLGASSSLSTPQGRETP